jgi:hypothetical protein
LAQSDATARLNMTCHAAETHLATATMGASSWQELSLSAEE